MPEQKVTLPCESDQEGNPNLSIWIALADAGFSTFPAGPDKKPLIKDWQGKATLDAATIRRWAERWPEAMPALPTGATNDLAVLDLDVRDDGRDGIAAAADLGIDPAKCISVRTPSGGLHLYFRHREGLTNARGHLPNGIDVRAQGGLVIAPGAVLPDGRRYTFEGGADLSNLELLRPFPKALMPPPRKERDEAVGHDDLTADDLRAILAELADAPRLHNGDRPWIEAREGNITIGMALHHWSGGSAEGFALWLEHAKQSTRFKGQRNLRDQWASFKDKPGSVTVGSLIAAAPAWCDARHQVQPEDFLDEEDQPEPFFRPMSEWQDKPVPPREWLVPNLVPMCQVTLLGGDGGTGKSLLALQLAIAVGTGRNWIGQPVDKPGRVLVLGAEDEDNEMHRRVHDICAAQRISLADLGNVNRRSLAGEDAVLAEASPTTGRLTPTALYKRLSKIIAVDRPRLVVLDTLSDLFSGNENDRVQARAFVGLLRHWAIKHRLAVVLLGHPSKSGMASGSGDSGSTAWNASVRSRLYLDTVKVNGVEADTSERILRVKKANYGPRGAELRLVWCDGCFTADDEFDTAERDDWAEEVFLDCLDEMTARGQHVSPNRSNSYAPTSFAKLPTACGISKREFESAMERLFARGIIVNREHGPASTRRVHIERGQK